MQIRPSMPGVTRPMPAPRPQAKAGPSERPVRFAAQSSLTKGLFTLSAAMGALSIFSMTNGLYQGPRHDLDRIREKFTVIKEDAKKREAGLQVWSQAGATAENPLMKTDIEREFTQQQDKALGELRNNMVGLLQAMSRSLPYSTRPETKFFSEILEEHYFDFSGYLENLPRAEQVEMLTLAENARTAQDLLPVFARLEPMFDKQPAKKELFQSQMKLLLAEADDFRIGDMGGRGCYGIWAAFSLLAAGIVLKKRAEDKEPGSF